MYVLIATQVAFCFFVLFLAGLFSTTLNRLSKRPLGFSPARVLTLETTARQAQSPVVWEQLADQLRATQGVESVALSRWPLLKGITTNGFVSVNGAPPGPVLAYFLNVSPGWLGTMKLSLLDGRDLGPNDVAPGYALVNEAFARQYFEGENPVGKTFSRTNGSFQVVGLVKDAPYRNLREPTLPFAYVPLRTVDSAGALEPMRNSTFVVRTTREDAAALAPVLRAALMRARPDFRVSDLRTQQALVDAQTVRERLLAMLAAFFAAVAVLLAAIGLYGVLDYSVLQRRREIGIRLAIGSQGSGIARLVAGEALAAVVVGSAVGLGLGLASGYYIGMLAVPMLAILGSSVVAALAPVLRAIRIDPIAMLRAE